jgi:hypothetical protein
MPLPVGASERGKVDRAVGRSAAAAAGVCVRARLVPGAQGARGLGGEHSKATPATLPRLQGHEPARAGRGPGWRECPPPRATTAGGIQTTNLKSPNPALPAGAEGASVAEGRSTAPSEQTRVTWSGQLESIA